MTASRRDFLRVAAAATAAAAVAPFVRAAAPTSSSRPGRSRTTGVAIAEIDADRELRVTFLRTSDPRVAEYGGVLERPRFRTPAGSARIERLEA